jgi:hypothetical protein
MGAAKLIAFPFGAQPFPPSGTPYVIYRPAQSAIAKLSGHNSSVVYLEVFAESSIHTFSLATAGVA